MHDLVKVPEDFYHHVMRTTCSIACAMVWGQRGATFDSFFGHVGNPFAVIKLLTYFTMLIAGFDSVCMMPWIR